MGTLAKAFTENFEPGMHVLTVRRARSSDMPAIHELISLLFQNSRSRHLPSDRYIIAERNGLPVGFCHYRFRGKNCYIAGLGVLSQYRNHGYGSQLLAEVLLDADENGLETTYLKVRALNTAAKLYMHFGFFEKRMGDVLLLVRKRQN